MELFTLDNNYSLQVSWYPSIDTTSVLKKPIVLIIGGITCTINDPYIKVMVYKTHQ